MYKLSKQQNKLEITMTASFDLIESICNEVKHLMEAHNLGELIFGVILGTREVLTNAVRHGSKMDANKKILFFMEIENEQIVIRVIDSGIGFDWKIMEKKQVSVTETHGRGIMILKQYFDAYHYNKSGNQIEIIKKTTKEPVMSEITKDGNKVLVKPDKDIVATNVNEIKGSLKQALSEEITEMTIDLANVGMMDSMGIGVLIATHNSLKKIHSQLSLINVSADLLGLLKTMRLHEHFNIQN